MSVPTAEASEGGAHRRAMPDALETWAQGTLITFVDFEIDYFKTADVLKQKLYLAHSIFPGVLNSNL